MKRFIKQLFIISILLIILLTGSLFLIPDYTARESALAVMPDKHRMLRETTSPRIIFLGGSNLCFGLDSRRIADTFNMPVVNLGLHAGIGLKFMMEDLKPYIRKDDIIVLSTEYTDYYSNQYYGNIELVSMLFDIYPGGLGHLDLNHWRMLVPAVFKYAAIKIIKIPRIIRYYASDIRINNEDIGYYNKYSFNEFGDTYLHWQLDNIPFAPYPGNVQEVHLNQNALDEIEGFSKYVNEKNAFIILLPPVLQSSTYKNQQKIIYRIDSTLKIKDIPFFKEPSEYCFPDSLFFNTPYHLNKKGIYKRTNLTINNLKDFFLSHKLFNYLQE